MLPYSVRNALAFTALVSVLLAPTSPTFAQGGGRGFGQGGGRGGRQQGGRGPSLATLPVATLAKMLNLSADQKTKITQIHDGYTRSVAGFRPQPGQRPDPETMQKRRELGTKANGEIEALLTPAQKTKWAAAQKELSLYRLAGIPMGLYGKIQLTADQKTKLQDIQKEMAGGQGGRDREGMRAIREKAAALLTPAQKAQVEKYRQEHPNERGGGFGGGGRRGGDAQRGI